MKEQILRKVNTIGNGAHVFTPKEWIGEEVFVVRILEKSLEERILSVLKPYLKDVEGVYLYGSYARAEAEKDSDIDILLITNKKIKIIQQGFEIITLQKDKIKKAIKLAPILIYSILAEARPIINSTFLEKLKKEYKPKLKNFKEYLLDSKRIIKINKEFLKQDEQEKREFESGNIAYSLILRLRGVFIINCLIKGVNYSHKKFKSWIKDNFPNIEYEEIYRAYKNIKKNKEIEKIKIRDLKMLLGLLEREIEKLREKIYGKKTS